jgi:aminopeptidase N
MKFDEKPTKINDIIPTNYPPSLSYKIEHMRLSIEPDFQDKRISAEQQLTLTTIKSINEIELDCTTKDSQIKVEGVKYSEAESDKTHKLDYSHHSNKLIINLGKTLSKKERFHIIIDYSAKSSKPGEGFYFVSNKKNKIKQAWTQGEAIESRNWFPCIDHPQLKFPREITVTVPSSLVVISNGEMDVIDDEARNIKKRRFNWEEHNPNPAYLTSIAIGDFVDTSNEKKYNGKVPLRYYVPKDRIKDADRTFNITPDVMQKLEQSFGVEYPYDKYTQVIVEDFPYLGMENTTCTTLTTRLLHDERAHLDFSSDDVIVHELAHQWFGDLVTCKDWQHIWLNEGFATYSEAMYFEQSKGKDEFQYNMMIISDTYLADKELYNRPIVNKNYKHPDELFDAVSYQKGGYIIYMIRNVLNDDEYFTESFRKYINTFKHGSAETDDFRQILEQTSGQSFQQFFDQWIYQPGHPILDAKVTVNDCNIELILDYNQNKIFEFPLELSIFLADKNNNHIKHLHKIIQIKEKQTTEFIRIPKNKYIIRLSIDSYHKILKQINYKFEGNSKLIERNIINNLLNGETIFERVEAARIIKNLTLKIVKIELLIENLKKSILEDSFWGVSVESVRALENFKSDQTYNVLKKCFQKVKHPKIRRALVIGLSQYEDEELFDEFKKILYSKNESYYVQYETAKAIAYLDHKKSFPILEKVVKIKSFRQLVTRGSIQGLKIIAIRLIGKDDNVVQKIIQILEDLKETNDDPQVIREATSALGDIIANLPKAKRNIKEFEKLTSHESVHIRNTAVAAIGNIFKFTNDQKAILLLESIQRNDTDGQVRINAKECISLIKKSELEVMEVSDDRLKKINLIEQNIAVK